METVARFDAARISKATKTREGWLRASCALTRAGVFEYRQPDGSIRREFRPPEEVFKADSLNTLKMVPITFEHPGLITATNAKQFAIGSIGENIERLDDSDFVVGMVSVIDENAVNEIITKKRRELSCGYTCQMIKQDGVYKGKPYDYIQKNIVYNHVALTKAGKAGNDVKIHLDSEGDIQFSSMDNVNEQDFQHFDSHFNKGVPNMAKVTIQNIEYEAAQEVINAYTSLQDGNKTLTTKLDSLTKELDSVKGEKDSLKEKFDSMMGTLPQKITDAVKARIALEKAASVVLSKEECAKLDSMDEIAIQKAVVSKVFPTAKLDGVSDEYLKARFDSALDTHKDEAIARQRFQSASRFDSSSAAPSLKTASESYREKLESAWKQEKK